MRAPTFVMVFLLAGCAASQPKPMSFEEARFVEPTSTLRELPKTLIKSELVNATQADVHHRSLGIALSGGGTKAAAFALGAVQGLIQGGVFGRATYLSTVSGGSYAGFYLYSRIANAGPEGLSPDSVSMWFADCVPPRYARPEMAMPGDSNDRRTIKLDGYDGSPPHEYLKEFGCDSEKPGWMGEFIEGPYPQQPDPLRYQNYLRANQDVFVDQCDLESTDMTAPVFRYTVGATLVQLPINLALTLFDWRKDLSATRNKYVEGLHTIYSAEPEVVPYTTSPAACRQRMPLQAVRPLTFGKLRELGRQPIPWFCGTSEAECRAPVWLINTTSSATDCLTDMFCYKGLDIESPRNPVPHQPELFRTVYTFSPFGFGSPSMGFAEFNSSGEANEPLTVGEAVAASSAFADPQQRQVGANQRRKAVMVPIMTVAGLKWGLDIANPARAAKRQEAYLRDQKIHNFLPWPFYLFHGYYKNTNSLYVHLSDGGQSENTGIFALLQRNMTDIIFVDAAQDEFGDFGDLCILDHHLNNGELPNGRRLKLTFDDPETDRRFQSTCHYTAETPAIFKRKRDESKHFCMSSGETVLDPLCNAPRVIGASFVNPANPNDVVRLQIIKPMVDVSPLVPVGAGRTLTDANGPGLPAEVQSFLSGSEWKRKDAYFPQLATTATTANFSAWLYGAYRELGLYVAKQVAYPDGESPNALSASGGNGAGAPGL